jgi:hypothetical protein
MSTTVQPTVSYTPYDPPQPLGTDHRGERRFLYGVYKVEYPDGFTVASAHAAYEGTISMEPVPLDHTDFAGTTYRQMLIESADEIKAKEGEGRNQ